MQNTSPRDGRRCTRRLNAPGRWGFVDGYGKIIVEPRYARVRSYSAGRAAVEPLLAGDDHDPSRLWGFVDREGVVVVEPTYEYANDFVPRER